MVNKHLIFLFKSVEHVGRVAMGRFFCERRCENFFTPYIFPALLTNTMQADDVEDFLSNADIGSVIFMMDPSILKNSLFIALSRFGEFPSIQNRCGFL